MSFILSISEKLIIDSFLVNPQADFIASRRKRDFSYKRPLQRDIWNHHKGGVPCFCKLVHCKDMTHYLSNNQRDRLDEATLSKPDIHRVILGHLDMYLPTSPSRQTHLEETIFEEDEKPSLESAGREASISGEQPLYLHGYYNGRVKLEPVAE